MPTLRPRCLRAGVVLLEVLVAITILTIVILSVSVRLSQTDSALVHARAATKSMLSASRYLDLIALWPREDLDRHLGRRRHGEWLIYIDRITPDLYEVSVGDSARPKLLRTVLYRAESEYAIP